MSILGNVGDEAARIDSLEDYMQLIEENLERITVRAQVDAGFWKTVPLASLPAPLAIKWAFRLLREKRLQFILASKP